MIILGSYIHIPFFFVPFTLQPFMIFILGLYLTPRESLSAILLYLGIGLLGIPVFAQGTGGILSIYKPTFGFLLGFVPMIYYISLYKKKNPIFVWLGATLILYTMGLSYLYLILNYHLSLNVSFIYILINYGVMFLPSDLLMFILAYSLHKNIRLKQLS